eukprot:519181_1
MTNLDGFSQLLQQCSKTLLQYLEPLDIDAIIEGIRTTKNSEYAIKTIQNVAQNSLNLQDVMNAESIEKRFKKITEENMHESLQYFRYFHSIHSNQILRCKPNKNNNQRLIEFILSNEYLSNDLSNDEKKAITLSYETSKYCNKKILNIKSNEVMCFKHKELIDWNSHFLQRKKKLFKRMYTTHKKQHLDKNVNVDENEQGFPKFYEYDIEVGYLSSNIKKCIIFLLEKGNGLNYGNEKRAKATSFILSKLLLLNIFEYLDFIALFDRLNQNDFIRGNAYHTHKFKMKLYWIPKIDPSFILSLQI